jgi:hypothetical protein
MVRSVYERLWTGQEFGSYIPMATNFAHHIAVETGGVSFKDFVEFCEANGEKLNDARRVGITGKCMVCNSRFEHGVPAYKIPLLVQVHGRLSSFDSQIFKGEGLFVCQGCAVTMKSKARFMQQSILMFEGTTIRLKDSEDVHVLKLKTGAIAFFASPPAFFNALESLAEKGCKGKSIPYVAILAESRDAKHRALHANPFTPFFLIPGSKSVKVSYMSKLGRAQPYILREEWWELRAYLSRVLPHLLAENRSKSKWALLAHAIYALRDGRNIGDSLKSILEDGGRSLTDLRQLAKGAVYNKILLTLLIMSVEGGETK